MSYMISDISEIDNRQTLQSRPVGSLRYTIAAEIKEYYFYLYYFQNTTKSSESAVAIRNKQLGELVDQGYVTVVPQTIHGGVNPGCLHVLGSFEEDVADDVPLEHPALGLGYSAKDAIIT
ncbi:hypothetical protein BG006_008739 [Podila minutissima]|uniref:Uncharacterized protein n=1 Tax=Podila minutissima TaxID=64525 RepID=A0A9P5SHW8_9FUNG|nr:hypothetical protein BG006_008739 [Podila minutissima]